MVSQCPGFLGRNLLGRSRGNRCGCGHQKRSASTRGDCRERKLIVVPCLRGRKAPDDVQLEA